MVRDIYEGLKAELRKRDGEIDRLRSALSEAEKERDSLRNAQPYLYIGKDGKPVLARDLEARAERAEATLSEAEKEQELTRKTGLNWLSSYKAECEEHKKSIARAELAEAERDAWKERAIPHAVMHGRMKTAEDELAQAHTMLKSAEQHVEILQNKIDGEKSCACGYDHSDDICSVHSPKLAKAEAELAQARNALKPFAEVAQCVLAEAPPEATMWSAYTDCEGNTSMISLGYLRRAALITDTKEGC